MMPKISPLSAHIISLKDPMSKIQELILEDVRCFQGEQRGNIRPITLLVGENSTGKSTFLACFSALHQTQTLTRFGEFDFNEEPFSMGAFRDIVRSQRGPSGRLNQFKLGYGISKNRKHPTPDEMVVTFEEQGSQPAPVSFFYRFGKSDFVEIKKHQQTEKTEIKIPDLSLRISTPFSGIPIHDLAYYEARDAGKQDLNFKKILTYISRLYGSNDSDLSIGMMRLLFYSGSNSQIIPVAPLRAKPKRTYDPVREGYSSDGDHIPMIMMKLNRSEKGRWQSLHDELVRFGKDSKLFTDIKVRQHGKQISDPFQIQVKAQSGTHANIMDVGYGVSQSLPILVDLLSKERNGSRSKIYLLQQPEVHLHPRGQAELANLFVRCVKPNRNQFLIETHSDYIIDRIRFLVRQKQIKPEDVSIIYFESKKNSVEMHNIGLDKSGGLKDTPTSYREFFLKETDRVLGFSD